MISRLQRIFLGMGIMAAVGLALPRIPATAAPPRPDPFAGDPRVVKNVTLSVEGLPVADLLALLAQKTGISLTAAREVADDKVIVFGPARPLRAMLADLATLFNDRWERHQSPDGAVRYVLTRDLSASRYEERLAHAATERILAQLTEQVRALAEMPEELARRPEKDHVRVFLSDGDLGRLGTTFYAALSQEQRETLFARRRLDIPFAALRPEHQEPLRKAWAERIASEQEFARQLQAQEPGRRIRISQPEDLEKGTLRFRIQHTGGFVSVGLGLGAHPVLVEAKVDDADQTSCTTSGWPVALLDGRTAWLLPPHGDPYTGAKPPADAPLPEARVILAAGQAKSWPDRLHKLADASGISLMADYYRGKPVARPPDAAAADAASDTPPAALDALCQPVGYLWRMRGKTLLLRKRDWYQQRSYEVPDRWMLSLVEQLKMNGGIPTLADLIRLHDLTETQIIGLNSLSQGSFVYDDDELTGLRELLAVVEASFFDRNAPLPHPGSAEPRTTELSDATMTPRQRALLAAFLETQNHLVPPAAITGFRSRFSCPEDKPRSTESGYRFMPVKIEWGLGSDVAPFSYTVSLPAALPDDRRDRTRVEVVP